MIKFKRRTSFKLFNKLLALFGLSFVFYVICNNLFQLKTVNKSLPIKQSNHDLLLNNQLEEQEEKINNEKLEISSELVKIQGLEQVNQIDFSNNANNFMPEIKFIQPINTQRLNKLFDIMLEKEKGLEVIFKSLNLFVFRDMIENKTSSDAYKEFGYELNNYLKVEQGKVRVTQSFVEFLNEISKKYSFDNPRNNVEKKRLSEGELEPTIVTAANSAYYDALQATLFHIHKHFPNNKIVVYDLGLNEDMVKLTVKYCKCEIRKFDSNKTYEKVAPHVTNLKVFSWKPLIVQESLRDFKRIIYVDSSIRFKSGDIGPILNVCKETGILTQYIGLLLTSYTNPKMFEWFQETWQTFEKFFTIEANIFFFYRNFINALLIKFWVTCSLHEDCIAPKGSDLHRFDQDAISIITSYFYGNPIHKDKFLPAYSFTTQESYFFEVRRYEGMNYFTKNA